MSKGIRLSSSQPDFNEVATLNTELGKAIDLYYSKSNPDYLRCFLSLTDEEIRAKRESRKEETESVMAMNLLAAIEASFRVDYALRGSRKVKDKFSREFRDLYRRKGWRVSLEDDILELWKTHSNVRASLVGDIRSVFKYRHWLAHGRYWVPKFGRNYDFLFVYNIAVSINREFSLVR